MHFWSVACIVNLKKEATLYFDVYSLALLQILHTKRNDNYACNYPLREKIANELLDGKGSANVWRNKEANRLIAFEDSMPPILYDGTVLCKAKQTELDKHLELKNTDPIKNIQLAKYTKFPRTIRNVGIDPFLLYVLDRRTTINLQKISQARYRLFLSNRCHWKYWGKN